MSGLLERRLAISNDIARKASADVSAVSGLRPRVDRGAEVASTESTIVRIGFDNAGRAVQEANVRRQEHWDVVYNTKGEQQVSWFDLA